MSVVLTKKSVFINQSVRNEFRIADCNKNSVVAVGLWDTKTYQIEILMQWNWKFYAMSLAVYWCLLETWLEKTRLASHLCIRVFQVQLRSFATSECSPPFSENWPYFQSWKGFLIQLTKKEGTSNSVSFSSANELIDLVRNQIFIMRMMFLARFRERVEYEQVINLWFIAFDLSNIRSKSHSGTHPLNFRLCERNLSAFYPHST